MPKKFSGENTKAVAAKERKEKAKELANVQKSLETRNENSEDYSKSCEKKLKKKEEEERKRSDYLKRKAELKDLLKKETESITQTKKYNSTKITKAQIDAQVKSQMTERDKSSQQKNNEPYFAASLTENLNRLSLNEVIARTIDDAVAILSDDQKLLDRHPEKRLKTAHKAYEEKRLKELRTANPTLKLSQLKEMVYREWKKMQNDVK